MRVVGVDLGQRRIGLAISDPSATIARPLETIERGRSDERAVRALLKAIDALNREEEVGCLVIGLPARLDGTPTDQTAEVKTMVALLAAQTMIPIVLQDERLSSHEAEARLALREPDWRRRKAKLDAATAAVILQDYLDAEKRKAKNEERIEIQND